ncbi:hypothetical protein DL96DRAFT_1817632 [Flagelloscypha sp. PMI_526]|nr:hypothetical protein DL96DRAFT_1817632 [Flagelloscypha sp. PMI_526]
MSTTITCQNPACFKQSNDKSEFRVCSACRRSSYCSVECQKAHWKDHKPSCKQTQASLNLLDERKGLNPQSSLLPGVNHEKTLEDLRKWSKHHKPWIANLLFQVSDLRNNLDFGQEYGVRVELEAHNTRQSSYVFTFKEAFPVLLSDILEVQKAVSSNKGEFIEKVIEQARRPKTFDGHSAVTGLVFIVCGGAMNVFPAGISMEVIDSLPEIDDWAVVLGNELKAPLGIRNPQVQEQLSTWWNGNRRAVVFCCANLLHLKPGGPIPTVFINFDIIYTSKGTPDQPHCKFTLLPPTTLSEPEWRQHVKGNPRVEGQVDYLIETRKTRKGLSTGEDGRSVIVTGCITGVPVTVGPYFITDNELKDITLDKDWRHTFYGLLVDYDLKY